MYLEIIYKLLTILCNITCLELASRFQSLSYRRNVSFLCVFDKYFHGYCLMSIYFLELQKFKRTIRLATRLLHFKIEISRRNHMFYIKSFFSRPLPLRNSLPTSDFSLKFDLQKCKCFAIRYVLSSWYPFFYCSLFS